MPRRLSLLLSLFMLELGLVAAGGAAGKFFPDDPIAREPETRDASKAAAKDIDLFWDLLQNLFAHPGDPNLDQRALYLEPWKYLYFVR